MDSKMKSLVALLCLCVCCNASRILENDALFIAPQNPSAFDPNLNLVMANGGTPAPNSATGLPCDEAPEMKSWSSSAINSTENKTNELEIKLKEDRTQGDAEKGKTLVYTVLSKGPVAPSGPSKRGNAAINGQGLARSMAPPAVYNKAESRQSGGVGHMEVEGDGKKRILGSAPSKGGAGH
ncbi:hypothetical protein SUGI_0253680 [Cryptomeria japonica]|nr:hypothetical protein SUGI_0253680 [Cryptomeria japonica]